ncbi:MAG: D-galactarolactone cycloisomerase [Myxococcales bacterium]|jgi:L-alanine-DL-glutamate epimerase-like enolase superfamily enzyme|nr:D-galactarolactone cycloisomerase [Myxococcales bacterium]
MKITQVSSFLMSFPFPQPLRIKFWNGERTILKRDAMLIRIDTDAGLSGFAPGPAHERADREIREVIAPFLLGRDPQAWASFNFQGDRELTKTYRAVEIALLDLTARAQGVPLSELAGGRVRDRIKLYGSAGMYMPPDGYAAEAAAVKAMGFSAYKMRPALGPDGDLETVEKMRRATGPGFGLMVDAHSWWRMGDKSYSPATVASLAAAMAGQGITWLEEPLPPENHAEYRRLRALGHVPVATGEHEPDEAGFMDLIDSGAADFVQMDVCCQGGFAMGARVVEAVRRRGLRFAFHSWGTTLEVLAAAHFGICWPEEVVEWLEYPCYANNGRAGMYPFPLADEILAQPLDIQNGVLTVPSGPGLGVEIDQRVIERYPFIPGPWSYFQIYSPPETIAVTGDHSVKWIEPPAGR